MLNKLFLVFSLSALISPLYISLINSEADELSELANLDSLKFSSNTLPQY